MVYRVLLKMGNLIVWDPVKVERWIKGSTRKLQKRYMPFINPLMIISRKKFWVGPISTGISA